MNVFDIFDAADHGDRPFPLARIDTGLAIEPVYEIRQRMLDEMRGEYARLRAAIAKATGSEGKP